MPRGYDEYLLDSLCQPGSEDDSPRIMKETTPVRRPSLAESLPRIPIRIEGGGVIITLKAGPHVRWTKLLSKWSECFSVSGTAPMAWPVSVRLGGSDEVISVTSIQESISRSIGPEHLSRVSEEDPALIVTVGQQQQTGVRVVEDVVPPETLVLPMAPLEQVAVPKKEEGGVQAAKGSEQIRVVIKSVLTSKKLKLNVSGNCLVSRLIRKWTEALKSERIDPAAVELFFQGELVDSAKVLTEVLVKELKESERYDLEAVPKNSCVTSSTTPVTKRKKQRRDPMGREQEAEFEFWKQLRLAQAQGLDSFIEEGEEEYVEDEEALAVALSLSESLS